MTSNVGTTSRRSYVRLEGPSTHVARGIEFLASLEGVCPQCWIPTPRKWCDRARRGYTCYWRFQFERGLVLDWAWIRFTALERDGHRCLNCGEPATEVDHILEIQDGGPEFDLANLRSLCHACHATKTAARRRWGPGRMVEQALRERVAPLNLKMEDFLVT